jgi:hypothetical protein
MFENKGFQYPRSGPNNAAEYMVSGLPFSVVVSATGSGDVNIVSFPFVSSEIYIQNRASASLSIGWTRNGVLGTNKYVLPANQAISFKIRCKDVFLTGVSGSVDVTAALTQISKNYYPTITGSHKDPNTGEFGYFSGSMERAWGWNGVG